MNTEKRSGEILGICFYTKNVENLLDEISKKGGLLVAPAAPNLAYMDKDKLYTQSIRNADYVLTDSGYLLLLWRLLKREKLPRLSGLGFLKALFQDKAFARESRFWVMPDSAASSHNLVWLNGQGLKTGEKDCYISPMFPKQGKVEDPVLLEKLNRIQPKYVIINIGGGIQEKLGLWLRDNLNYSPVIICTGAAIAFLSGLQASIPAWADRYCLGWFFRCLNNPFGFIPRYLKSFRLLRLLLNRSWMRSEFPGE